MFDGLKRLWGRIVSMFNYTTLKNIIGKDVALSQTMIDAINKWKKMLVGNADWCSDIVESLKLEEGICREFADSVLVEMEAKILNNDKMDKVLQKSLSDMSKKLQTGLALGAMVLITNKKTVTVSGKTDDVSSKPVTVTVNGATVTVGTDGTFTKDVTLAEGANTITIVAKDKAGKTTTVTRKVTVDTSAPVIKSVTLTPNPVDCGKTFIIAVEITD